MGDCDAVTSSPTRWLLIDDDPVFARTLARAIERGGNYVLVANDANEALAQARASNPHRVLLDLRLGDQSGLRLLPALRAALPTARIVILTGFGSIATAVQAMKDGADHYLSKPVQLRDVLAAFDNPSSDVPMEFEPMSPRRLEWEHIHQVLMDEDGNVSRAARRLGMHRRTLQRKLAKKPSPQ